MAGENRLTIPKTNGHWPPRPRAGLDPGLVGLRAFRHPAVQNYWEWLLRLYTPRSSIVLVTPCSNVKPYPYSPASGKVRGVLRRLGLWDGPVRGVEGRPRGIEWLYFSDLLVFVPYEKSFEYPACCYEVPPELVLENGLAGKVAGMAAKVLEKMADRVEVVVAWLPEKHRRLLGKALDAAKRKPRTVYAKYSLFTANPLEEVLQELL